MTQQALPFAPRQADAQESDMALWHRARCAGWQPLPRHCPEHHSALVGDWRECARRFLQTRPA